MPHTTDCPVAFKRLIVCCDGSWMDTLGSKGGEPQSNVSRISRTIKRTCHDGTHQVILYDAGVGTGASKIDQLTGGGFGMGLAENVRECYNFICSNYVDGDDVILVGFSRGAFTARSIADMIATIGLLTIHGLDYFYKIFEDYQNISNPKRSLTEFLCPENTIPRYDKGLTRAVWVADRKAKYKEFLKSKGYTRDTFTKDPEVKITIKALAVWDTVGTLGIPPVSILGLHGSADQWKFSGTNISDRVLHAFQALALDEPRDAFKPALWERLPTNTVTDLKQVWFPGNHGGVGGGWYDQQIANITLAWMCDQLSSIGVEFNFDRMQQTMLEGVAYSAAHPFPFVPNFADRIKLPSSVASWFRGEPLPWARGLVYDPPNPIGKRDPADCSADCRSNKHPDPTTAEGKADPRWAHARPWALGQTRYPSLIQAAIGSSFRHPGLYTRTNPDNNTPTDEPLVDTAERVHSSVRVRLACQGLAMDDAETWRCEGLLGGPKESFGRKGLWRLERGSGLTPEEQQKLAAAIPPAELAFPECPNDRLYNVRESDGQFRWVFADDANLKSSGQAKQLPQSKVLAEEPLTGFWERYLLGLATGSHDVWRWAEENPGV